MHLYRNGIVLLVLLAGASVAFLPRASSGPPARPGGNPGSRTPALLPATGAPPKAPQQLPPVAALKAQLGKQIFFDTSLSNPPGMACATCHSPQAGFTNPDPKVNLLLGPVPGIVPGRFGNRKPPTVSYAAFSPAGPTLDPTTGLFVGGLFWDGRAPSLAAQAQAPLFNPNEMNNIVGNAASPALVASKLSKALYAPLFRQVYGSSAFSGTPQQVVAMLTDAVAAFESTPAVSPFNSRYDAYLAGKVVLTASELNGLRMFTGSTTGRPGGPAFTPSAQCFRCHSIPAVAGASTDLFTSFAYFNTGVPKNPNNPYYTETNARTNPLGYNPLGAAYIDLGLGDYLYPARGLPVGNAGAGSNGLGDFLASNGTFKTPTLRNVDKRPAPGFVKAYGHNGVFKSLQDVVHFYNVRNLTSKPGEVIDFTRANPYAGLAGTPLFAAPEYPSAVTLINSTGKPGQIGNLGLTPQQEADLIAFLQTLSDS